MKYEDQIKHPEWQKKRLEILERDKFTCRSCGDTKTTLHVHHVRYKKDAMIWDYDNSILITLCELCHDEWHDLRHDLDTILPILNKDIRNLFHLILDIRYDYGFDKIPKIRSILMAIFNNIENG